MLGYCPPHCKITYGDLRPLSPQPNVSSLSPNAKSVRQLAITPFNIPNALAIVRTQPST